MATEYDLKLVVDADTTEAQRKLDELAAAQSSSPAVQQAAQRVRDFVSPSPERAQPAPRPLPTHPAPPPASPAPRPLPTPPAPPPASPAPRPQQPPPAPPQSSTPKVHAPAAQEAADRVRRLRLDPSNKPNLSNNPDDFGKKAGDVAGRAIGKAVAGFLAHEVASTLFNGLKTPGGDNSTVNKAEASVGGALKYGTMGAMLGGPIGAIIGGLVGAGMGYLQEDQRQQNALKSRDRQLLVNENVSRVQTAMGASDSAFSRSLEMAGGSRQRLEMIRARRDAIESGDNEWSIKTLTKLLQSQKDPESDNSKFIASNIEMQRSRVAQLDRQLLDEGLADAPSRMDAGSVADSWAKRGIQVGAQVDVAQVNEKIMGEVQSCRSLLEKIANMTNNQSNIREMQAAVFQ